MRVEYFTQMAIGDVKPKGSTEILLASLAEEGLKPEDIDTVIYTHLHNDHAGQRRPVPRRGDLCPKGRVRQYAEPLSIPKGPDGLFP